LASPANRSLPTLCHGWHGRTRLPSGRRRPLHRTVFGTEFIGPIARFGDVPHQPGMPPVPEADRNLVTHIELPILAGHVIMGTDVPESRGFKLTPGDNVTLNLEPDTRAETDRLYQALSEGGKAEFPMQEMFWGGYFGICIDRFGMRWMFNCAGK
jgi:PhnB protein